MDPEELDQLSPAEAPLVMRMMEHIPGISASLGFATFRGSNTLMRGGFMDDRMLFKSSARSAKYSSFAKGSMTPSSPSAASFYGKSARRARLAAAAGTDEAKMAFGKVARVNHITARPRALSRYHSLSIFNASETSGMYSPFQIAYKGAGRAALRSPEFTKAIGMSDEVAKTAKGGDVFQRGMVSMITAGRRIDLLEAKAAGGSARALKKVGKAQLQVQRLAMMNNPSIAQGLSIIPKAQMNLTTFVPGQGMVATPYTSIGYKTSAEYSAGSFAGQSMAKGAGEVGVTGNLMASAGSTAGSRYVQGYFRGALGHAGAKGLTGEALTGAQKAVSHMETALTKIKFPGVAGAEAQLALKEGVFKTLGKKGVFQSLATREGAMVMGARGAAMAIPGLNVIATASLVYDLARMGGELIKSGVNLAKDSVKSLKGTIDKPMFGMGYKDNEVAATSRARGVMAIQNSRLNARSLLGSEASMMASHFG